MRPKPSTSITDGRFAPGVVAAAGAGIVVVVALTLRLSSSPGDAGYAQMFDLQYTRRGERQEK